MIKIVRIVSILAGISLFITMAYLFISHLIAGNSSFVVNFNNYNEALIEICIFIFGTFGLLLTLIKEVIE